MAYVLSWEYACEHGTVRWMAHDMYRDAIRRSDANRRARTKPINTELPAEAAVVGGVLVTLALGVPFLLWPALVWHGYGGIDGNSWRWDMQSTVACAIWWGSLVALTLLCWGLAALGRRFPPIP